MRSNPPFDLQTCARPNILALKPYVSPRDQYENFDNVTLLDANEHAFGPSIAREDAVAALASGGEPSIQSALDPDALRLNRYPDAQQTRLRQLLCDLRNINHDTAPPPLKTENICLGVGADESIDGIIRAFCTPSQDKIMICPPTYDMYEVSAHVNDVDVVKVNLDPKAGFELQQGVMSDILSKDPHIKVVFITSPANPTGNVIDRHDIFELLDHPTWNGVFVIDEAYIDFAETPSYAPEVARWNNLIVIQTMSKAFGLAGIRLGVTYSPSPISELLNNLKGPYNMSAPTVALATAALQPSGVALMQQNRFQMLKQRRRLEEGLLRIAGVGGILGVSETNFLLVQFLSKPTELGGIPDNAVALAVQGVLASDAEVLVRYRGKEPGCVGSLRITVGTAWQVNRLLRDIENALGDFYADKPSLA